MTGKKLSNGYWTDLKLQLEAAKYRSTVEWAKKNPSSYSLAKRRNLVPVEMPRGLDQGKWTKAKVIEIAKECKTRGEFRETHPSAYSIAATKGWLEDVSKHMLAKAPWFGPRVIKEYLLSYDISFIEEYKFKDDDVVKKLPYDFYLPELNAVIEYQGRQHKEGWHRSSSDAKEIQFRDELKRAFSHQRGMAHLEFDQSTKRLLIDELAQSLKMLATNTGTQIRENPRELTAIEKKGIDSPFKWTTESVEAAVKGCTTIKEFRSKHQSAYDFALKHGIWQELSKQLKRKKQPGKYSLEFVTEAAKECMTRNEFKLKHRGAWAAAQRNGWLEIVCMHMPMHVQRTHKAS